MYGNAQPILGFANPLKGSTTIKIVVQSGTRWHLSSRWPGNASILSSRRSFFIYVLFSLPNVFGMESSTSADESTFWLRDSTRMMSTCARSRMWPNLWKASLVKLGRLSFMHTKKLVLRFDHKSSHQFFTCVYKIQPVRAIGCNQCWYSPFTGGPAPVCVEHSSSIAGLGLLRCHINLRERSPTPPPSSYNMR